MNLTQKLLTGFIIGLMAIAPPNATRVMAEALDQKEIRNVARSITVKIVNSDTSSNASGVLFSRKGNVYSVLTNQHVLAEQGNYEIFTSDGQKHLISSQEEIPGLDLMVVQFQSTNEYQTAELGDSEEIAPLQLVYVSGYPAIQADLDIVDGKIRSIRQDVLKNPQDKLGYALVYTNQTLPGSSGGAVLNEQGYLVGINGEAERDLISGRDISRGIPINLFISLSINYLPERAADNEDNSEAKISEEQRREAERLAAQRQELERLEEERREAQKRESERLEEQRQELERLEEERREAQKREQERLEAQQQEQEPQQVEVPEQEESAQVAYLPNVTGNSNYSLAHRIAQQESEIKTVAITPDGKTIVTGGDRQINVWNGQSGSLEKTISGHEEGIKTVAISADGNTIVSGGNDGRINIWNRSTGSLERTLVGHESEINSIALSLDGNIIASGGGDRQLRVWNRRTGNLERTFEGHDEEIKSVAVSADGETIVTGGQDKQVKVWKWRSWELKQTLKSHQEEVRAVAISADGNTIVSGSGDRTIKVWDDAGQLKYTLRGHEEKVDAIALSNDGHIISGSRDRTIKIWNLQTQALEQSLETDSSDEINSIAVSAYKQVVVSVNKDKTLSIWYQK